MLDERKNDKASPRWEGLREVSGMAFPIVVGSLSHTVMTFVDQVMVSRLGTSALAAVGSAGLWAFTLSTFFLGVVSCVATFVSQSLGRGEPANCARYAWQGLYISGFTGVLALLLWPAGRWLFQWMGHAPDVTHMEVVYFRIRLTGYAFIAGQAALSSFFQAIGRPKIPMAAALAANALNIFLDYAIIFGKCGFPRWGIGGAAVATVIALVAQTTVLLVIFLGPTTHAMFTTRTSAALDRQKVRELLRIGWPAGFSFLMDLLNWSVFTGFMVGRFGTSALAAHNATCNITHLSFMPAVGLNHAIAPIVGRWIGRGDIVTAKSRTYTAMRLAVVYMFTVGVLIAVFGKPTIRTFFSRDADVVNLGHTLLILAAIFQGFDAINITVSGALRGAGDTRWMAVACFIAGYAFFLPTAYVLAFQFQLGAVGAWLGATAYIIGLSGVLFRRFQSDRWRQIRIFEKDRFPA